MSDTQSIPSSPPSTWATRANSAATAESLAALAGADPGKMAGADLVDAIVASEKALSFLAGTQMRLLAALAKPFVAGDPMRLAARLAKKNCAISDDSDEMVQFLVPDAAISLASAEVAAALRISPVTAGIRVREANMMTTALAPILAALEKGVVDRGKARIIAEHCEPLDKEDKAAVQDLVLPLAGAATNSELRDLTGQAVITVDPDGCDERHRAASARRELAIKALPDAMATLKALLPADGAVKIFQLTDLLATATAGVDGDNRGIGARRIDAWVDIADQLLTFGSLDLSHYLGEPLPDHGTPKERTCVDGQADGVRSRNHAGPDVPTRSESGNSGPNVAAGTGPGTCAGGESDGGTTPANDTSTGTGTGTGTGTASDRGTATESDGSTADGTDTGTGMGAETNAGHHDNAAQVGSTFGARHLDCRAPGAAGPLTDADPIAEPADGHSPTVTSKKLRRPAQAMPSASSGSGRRCNACGSVGQSDKALTRQGRRPHLSVTLGLVTLAGLDNLPGKLAGFGAIPPGLARSIAKSAATITALCTDPETGSITDAGALVYRPRQALRDQIAATLETCQFPSCRQPVWRCDIDHRKPFDHHNPEQGGHTTRENTGPYCRRHHLFKHHTEWRTHPDPNSSMLIWISPTGHRYVRGRSQATPPDIWIATGGTTLAERLDNIRVTTDVDDGTRRPGSVPEELLTAMLLQRELNRPPFEYDPAVSSSASDKNAANSAEPDDAANRHALSESADRNNADSDSTVAARPAWPWESSPGRCDVPDTAAPNAASWPTIDDPPPF